MKDPFEKTWLQSKIDLIRWKFIRIYRRIVWGFDPKELWSLDHTMAKWVIPRLKRLKETKHGVPHIEGFPVEHDEESFDEQCRVWYSYLDKMIEAFTLILKEFDDVSVEEMKDNDKKIEEGLFLFAKYYRHLND